MGSDCEGWRVWGENMKCRGVRKVEVEVVRSGKGDE